MSRRDAFDTWKAERQDARVPQGFADSVMGAIGEREAKLGAAGAPRALRSSPMAGVFTLAAGACIAVVCHAAFVCALLLAASGVAR